MTNEILPEPPESPQPLATEAEAQAARRVTERLNKITARANYVKRRFFLSVAIVIPCFFLGGYIVSFFNQAPALMRYSVLILSVGSISIAWGRVYTLRTRDTPGFDVEEIAKRGGLKAIEPLAATLQNTSNDTHRQAITNALIILLQQMKASDSHLLTPAARRTIHSWLGRDIDFITSGAISVDLRIAALKALEQVGDSSAIPAVKRLTKMKAQTQGQKKIKQAAIECLPMLRANCGEVETARTLLRASQPEATDPKTLLRPASGAGTTDKDDLLRGTDAPDAPPSEGPA